MSERLGSVTLDWRGPKVFSKMLNAAVIGIDSTMAASVADAKRNHPGWKNRTGTAEGSVRITKFASKFVRGRGRVRGQWGSLGVNYVIFLELKHGSFLRTSADRNYPKLAGAIRAAMG